jgi:hypothetical protein
MQEPVSLADLTSEDFVPHVNSIFEIQSEDGNHLPLTLIEVTKPVTSTSGHRAWFSLRFTGTPGSVLPQQIYRLTHAVMGTLDIFLVPIGATPEATKYEAVFG